MFKIILGVLVVAVVAITVFMVIDPKINVVSTNDNSNVTVLNDDDSDLSSSKYVITVEGEVAKEGSYGFANVPTMADLITAAGGITSSADERSYYSSSELTNGKTYFIASKYESNNVCSLTELSKVNINTDNADTLLNVSGFTTSVANSVVSYRADKGQFNTIEDLLEVYGIGNATYRKVRNYVILHE